MKKQLDLNKMELVELNPKEMESVEGGGIFGAILGFVVGAALELILGPQVEGGTDSSWLLWGLQGAAFGSLLPF